MKTLGAPEFCLNRDEIIGFRGTHQISNLGVVQFEHGYDAELLSHIAKCAENLKRDHAQKRHLDLKYIRGAHLHIPEILEVVNSQSRIERLSELAGTRIEPYPISVISTIVTFSGPAKDDGTIHWHCDGVPATELVPLAISDLEGGELEIFRGPAELGLHNASHSKPIRPQDVISLRHRMGFSIFGQLMRVAHRVRPISQGSRVTLNMNVRSATHPYIDDNNMCYLAADNPDFAWADEYFSDVRQRQLPAYLKHQT